MLSEIGITAMGDVINILKYAKKVHSQVSPCPSHPTIGTQYRMEVGW